MEISIARVDPPSNTPAETLSRIPAAVVYELAVLGFGVLISAHRSNVILYEMAVLQSFVKPVENQKPSSFKAEAL